MQATVRITDSLLWMYKERFGNPAFWAEPLNAITNASFLIAAVFAWDLAARRRVNNRETIVLLSLASAIAVGSFLFHTMPNSLTMWMDMIPIATFQLYFLWLVGTRMLKLSRGASATLVTAVVGSSFAFFPLHNYLNGSLFYLPVLIAMLVIGFVLSSGKSSEPKLLLWAAGCFSIAVVARTGDWIVPWKFGSHFLWHSINGVVIYLALRAWIVFADETEKEKDVSTSHSKTNALIGAGPTAAVHQSALS